MVRCIAAIAGILLEFIRRTTLLRIHHFHNSDCDDDAECCYDENDDGDDKDHNEILSLNAKPCSPYCILLFWHLNKNILTVLSLSWFGLYCSPVQLNPNNLANAI